jgi:hypothetical protein
METRGGQNNSVQSFTQMLLFPFYYIHARACMATAADEAFNSPTSLTLPPSKMYHGTIIINKVLTTKKAS